MATPASIVIIVLDSFAVESIYQTKLTAVTAGVNVDGFHCNPIAKPLSNLLFWK